MTTLSPTLLQAHQQERTRTFDSLVGRGAIRFTWTDNKGTHKEQGDFDFWKNGESISLRISKLGELIAWFGGNGSDIWFFDMMVDEPTLTIGGDRGMFNDVGVALVLLGLMPLPDGELTYQEGVFTLIDSKNRIWNATFESDGIRPRTIEVIDKEYVASATHLSPLRVELAERHELHWPLTGGNIDLVDNKGDAEIKIAFSSLSTIVEEEPMDRVMSVEYLKNALKPAVVIQAD